MGYLISTLREPPSEECQSSVDALSDDELYALIDAVSDEDAIGFKESPDTPWNSEVDRITSDAVVKYGNPGEAFAMTYVSSLTSIPIPRVRRTLRVICTEDPKYKPNAEWIVMDLVDGEPLVTAWPTLSCSKASPCLGPMHSSGKPMVCQGYYFAGVDSGPFRSYDELVEWFDRSQWHSMRLRHETEGEVLRCLKFDRTHPLVVCHMDLDMRNSIVHRKGVPWIIGWGDAGVYPAWFEYCRATCSVYPSAPPEWQAPWLWRWSTTFMFGNYRKYSTNFFKPLAPLWQYGIHDHRPLDHFEKLGIDID